MDVDTDAFGQFEGQAGFPDESGIWYYFMRSDATDFSKAGRNSFSEGL